LASCGIDLAQPVGRPHEARLHELIASFHDYYSKSQASDNRERARVWSLPFAMGKAVSIAAKSQTQPHPRLSAIGVTADIAKFIKFVGENGPSAKAT
jgi:hypothetical protein